MDEVNETTLTAGAFTIEDNSTSNNDINVNAGGGGANVARTYWGTKNRSINFDPTDSIAVTNANITDSGTNGTFTFSFWTQSFNAVHSLEIHLGDINLSVSGNSLSLRHPLSGGFLGNIPYTKYDGHWNNIVCRYDGTQDKVELFVNGENKINETIIPGAGNALNFPVGNNGVLLDEMMVYNRALTDAEIGHLAGNVFLDLSGNKYNAVALGTGFEMDSTNDAGSVNNSFSGDLGEAISIDGNNSQRYLDLTTHIKSFSGLDMGTVAFWIKPNSLASDMTVLSGSCTDDNQSYFRILLRDNGKIRTEVYNDETEYCKLSSGGSTTIGPSNWSHVAVVIGENGISYFINGKSVPVVVPPDSSNARAFLADVDNLNFLAIGKHQTKEVNATNYFNGQLDELQIFQRVLTGGEIQYLYNVGKEQGVQRAILSPQVDAIGTVTVTNVGAGYKEVPEVDFNVTSYFGQDGFTAPAGEVELNATSVDQILLTKDFDKTVKIILPDTSEILRTSAEYVMVDPNNSRAVIPIGLFGYSSPPNLILEGSPDWPDERNATGYSLFFIDENQSGEVVHGGAGYDLNNSRYIHSFTDDTNTTTYEIIKLKKLGVKLLKLLHYEEANW